MIPYKLILTLFIETVFVIEMKYRGRLQNRNVSLKNTSDLIMIGNHYEGLGIKWKHLLRFFLLSNESLLWSSKFLDFNHFPFAIEQQKKPRKKNTLA